MILLSSLISLMWIARNIGNENHSAAVYLELSDLLWNDRALGYFWTASPQQEEKKKNNNDKVC